IRRWRNSPQGKGQEEITARDLLSTDISNISDQEFRTTVIRLLAGLEKSTEDTKETLAAEIKGLRTSQDEINAVTQMQSKLDTVTVRTEEAEEKTGEIENKIMENDGEKQRERKLLDHKGRIKVLSDSMKQNNIRITGIPEEEQEKGAEDLSEQIIPENLTYLGKETDTQVQEAQRTPFKINKNVSTP
ncbi:LORF1 protein, partial [Crocuta crocuta]